jgi:membrane fusion protein (multidrug efflux system)
MNAVAEKPAPLSAEAQSRPDAAPPPRRAPRRGRAALKLGLLLGVAAGALLVGNWWFTEAAYIESTDNAYVQGDIAVLGPRIDGDVIRVDVADNQPVKAGQPLIELDPRDRQAQLDQAVGADGEARAAIAVAQRQVEQQRSVIAQDDAAIASAQAELTRASADAARSGALTGAGWTSRQANDQAVADRLKAQAQLASAMAARDSAREMISVAQAQLLQAQAHLVSADAAVQIARNNLGYTVLRAPFDGVASNRAVQVGAHVMPGQQIISVAPLARQLYVVANFKETQLAHMQPNQKVVLTPDIDTHDAVTGRVQSLAPATGALFSLLPPENATGNFTKVVQRVPVRIAIDPAEAARATWLRAGLSVTAEVDTRGPDSVRVGMIGAALRTLGLK